MDIIPDVCEVPVTAAWEKLEVQQLQLSVCESVYVCVCVFEEEKERTCSTYNLPLPN